MVNCYTCTNGIQTHFGVLERTFTVFKLNIPQSSRAESLYLESYGITTYPLSNSGIDSIDLLSKSCWSSQKRGSAIGSYGLFFVSIPVGKVLNYNIIM